MFHNCRFQGVEPARLIKDSDQCCLSGPPRQPSCWRFESTPGAQEHEGFWRENVAKPNSWGAKPSTCHRRSVFVDSIASVRNGLLIPNIYHMLWFSWLLLETKCKTLVNRGCCPPRAPPTPNSPFSPVDRFRLCHLTESFGLKCISYTTCFFEPLLFAEGILVEPFPVSG